MSFVRAPAPAVATRPAGGRATGLGALALGLAAVAWGGNQFTPLLVMYRRQAGYSSQTVTVLLAAYVLGIVPALLVGGPLSDRLGRRPLMLPAPLVSAAGSLLLAVGAHSAGLLFAGRMLSGLALGLGMAVGTSWLKELVQVGAAPAGTSGAGRAAAALTAGFAAGAAAAAALAQFAPWPTVLPYLPHLVLAAVATTALGRATETRPPQPARRPLLADLLVPAARQRRFLLVVLPMAPFVFGLASAAYAILPGLLGGPAARLGTAVSGLHCLVGLGCGMAVQPLGARLGRRGPGRPVLVGLATGIAGLLLGAAVIPAQRWTGFLVAAAALGMAYGLLMIAGLQEVQRMAGPDDLAGLTAVYYAATYVGFIAPALLAALHHRLGYPVMFVGWAGLGLVAAAVVVIGLLRTDGPATRASRRAERTVSLVGSAAN